MDFGIYPWIFVIWCFVCIHWLTICTHTHTHWLTIYIYIYIYMHDCQQHKKNSEINARSVLCCKSSGCCCRERSAWWRQDCSNHLTWKFPIKQTEAQRHKHTPGGPSGDFCPPSNMGFWQGRDSGTAGLPLSPHRTGVSLPWVSLCSSLQGLKNPKL